MAEPQTSSNDPYYLLAAFLGGVYLTLLGLSLVVGARRWIGIFPLALGCALLYIASQLIRTGLSIRTPLIPRELELRYVFAGQEIVSRGQVSTETFFHTRGMKTLKIKILPACPEDWVALG